MQWRVSRSKLSGTCRIPPSKSHTIRAILVATLAAGRSTIRRALVEGDGESALRAARALGAQATLTGDLGAESIDFLDIVFRLEKSFSIKIPRGELFPDNILNNPEFVQNGRLTPAGLTQLKKGMPHADFSEFERNPDINKMAELFKVQTIVNYVSGKVA